MLGIEINAGAVQNRHPAPELDRILEAVAEAQNLLGSPESQPDPVHIAQDVLPRATILVVDDQPEVGQMVSDLLQGKHNVHIVQTGAEALSLLEQTPCAAVLIDLELPDQPGDRLAQQIRRISPGTSTVLITGWQLPPEDPRRHPFDFHLEKPFQDRQELQNTIARAIERRHRRSADG